MNVRTLVALTGSLLVFGASCSLAFAGDDAIRYRGVGATRQALDAMQLKPFDQSLWANLRDWSAADFKPESAGAGKVVMIVTWASWHRVSHPALRTAQAIATKFAGQDLVVVGVHNPRGFDAAGANAKELGVTFPFAADPDGKFRSGLRAEADPNVYFIDRAGNLRFAQIEIASAESAATQLLGESAESARDLPKVLADKRAQDERDRFKTSDIGAGTPPVVVNVPFTAPDEEAYKKVRWPYLIGKVETDRILEKISNTPPTLTVLEDNWYPARPNIAGRLVAAYIIDPLDTDMLNVVPVMNAIATRYQRDVAVYANCAKLGEGGINVQGEDANKLIQRNSAAIQGLLAQKRLNHPLQAAPLKMENFSENGIPLYGSKGRREAGVVMVLSTDSKVRWIGDPYSPGFKRALDELIAVDPGVIARRKAEDAKKK